MSYWTGKKCPPCKGTGIDPKDDFNARACPACGGTGEEYDHEREKRDDIEDRLRDDIANGGDC